MSGVSAATMVGFMQEVVLELYPRERVRWGFEFRGSLPGGRTA